jgi:hypothetical protein
MRIISIFFVVISCFTYSQEDITVSELKEKRKQRKETAIKQITELKDATLFVRLDFDQKQVDYYTKYENFEEAEKVKVKAQERNTNIVDAFKTHYDFCPVVYFRSEDSRHLLKGEMDSVAFYNVDGEIDVNIQIDGMYFIAEFGNVEPDELNSSGDTKTSKPALVIRDQQFNQLRDPFPYFHGYLPQGSVKKRYRTPVKKWTEKLHAFYKKHYAQEVENN